MRKSKCCAIKNIIGCDQNNDDCMHIFNRTVYKYEFRYNSRPWFGHRIKTIGTSIDATKNIFAHVFR